MAREPIAPQRADLDPAIAAFRAAGPVGDRRVWFAEAGGWTDCPIHDRAALAEGARLEGPAILEQMDTTTVLHPGQSLRCDAAGKLVISVDGAS